MKLSVALALFTTALPFLSTVTHAYPRFYPRIPDTLPAGTVRIGFDDDTGLLIGFDAAGNELGAVAVSDEPPPPLAGKRQTGSCQPLSVDDLKALPGFPDLEAQAKEFWGDGKFNLVTNPEDFRDRPANICASSDEIQITQDGEPDCKTTTQTSEGQTVGTNGTVSLQQTQGTTFATTATVTREASVAQGITVEAKVGIPEIADVTVGTSTTLTFTNTQSQATTNTNNQQTTQTVTVNSQDGKTCKLNFETTSCTITGKGELRFIASGFAWFNFEDKVDGHFKWALNIESVVTDEAQRSTTLGFNAAMDTSTNSKFNNVCE